MFVAVSLDTQETGVKQVRNVLSKINSLEKFQASINFAVENQAV